MGVFIARKNSLLESTTQSRTSSTKAALKQHQVEIE